MRTKSKVADKAQTRASLVEKLRTKHAPQHHPRQCEDVHCCGWLTMAVRASLNANQVKISSKPRSLKSLIKIVFFPLIFVILALNSSFLSQLEIPLQNDFPLPQSTVPQDHTFPDWYLTTECSVYSLDCVSREIRQEKYLPYPFPLVNENVNLTTLSNDLVTWKNPQSFPRFHKNKKPQRIKNGMQHVDSAACMKRAQSSSLQEQFDILLPKHSDFQSESDSTNQRIAFTISDYSYSKDMIDDMFFMARNVMHLKHFFLVAIDQATIELACDRGFPVLGWAYSPSDGSEKRSPNSPMMDESSYKSKKQVIDVAMSKWFVALEILKRQFPIFFFEMDVWFLKKPQPLWKDQKVDILFGGHADNPNYINIGIYSALPTDRSREYFQVAIDLFQQRPNVHDQFIMMQINWWETAAKDKEEIVWRKNFGSVKDIWGTPPPPMPVFQHGYATHGRFPIWQVVSSERPILSEETIAIHLLSGRPLTAPHGKQQMAKELGIWVGSNGYYDSEDARYLWMDGHIFNGISVTMTYPGRSNWYQYHDFDTLRWAVSCTVALANHTSRIWVMPKVVNNRGFNFLWTILDMQTVEPFVDVRETTFPSNPRTWKTPQRYHHVSRIAISGDKGGQVQLYRQDNAWPKAGASSPLPEAWNRKYESASKAMEWWFALAEGTDSARVLLAGLPAVQGLLNPLKRIHDRIEKQVFEYESASLEHLSNKEKKEWLKVKGMDFLDESGAVNLDISIPIENVLTVYRSLKWCRTTFDQNGLLELLPATVTASDDCYGLGQPMPYEP